jgi:ankyrin repeat protein
MKDKLTCPLTGLFFCDPVVAEDRYVYEHMAIANWLKTHNTSPKTGQKMGYTYLRCETIKEMVTMYLKQHPEYEKDQFMFKKPFYLFEKDFFDILKEKQFDKVKDFTSFELNYDIGKETLFELACKICPTEAIKHIIDLSIDYDVEDKKGLRPIHIACKYSSDEIIRHLVAKGVSLESVDLKGNRPLNYLLNFHSQGKELIKFFLDKNIDINYANNNNSRPIHHVIASGDLELFMMFESYCLSNSLPVVKSGLNILQYAFCESPNIALIEYMIEKYSNLDADVDLTTTCEQLLYKNDKLNKRDKQQMVLNYLRKLFSKPIVDVTFLEDEPKRINDEKSNDLVKSLRDVDNDYMIGRD